MNIDHINETLSRQEGLSKTLGMEFISTPDDDTCMARMRVNSCNRQPFGFLSGGAGVGSLALCPDKIGVGINVSGSHMKAVLEGDTVTATARLLHKGRTLHQWHVEIRNEAGELISSVEVTNYIIPKG